MSHPHHHNYNRPSSVHPLKQILGLLAILLVFWAAIFGEIWLVTRPKPSPPVQDAVIIETPRAPIAPPPSQPQIELRPLPPPEPLPVYTTPPKPKKPRSSSTQLPFMRGNGKVPAEIWKRDLQNGTTINSN